MASALAPVGKTEEVQKSSAYALVCTKNIGKKERYNLSLKLSERQNEKTRESGIRRRIRSDLQERREERGVKAVCAAGECESQQGDDGVHSGSEERRERISE